MQVPLVWCPSSNSCCYKALLQDISNSQRIRHSVVKTIIRRHIYNRPTAVALYWNTSKTTTQVRCKSTDNSSTWLSLLVSLILLQYPRTSLKSKKIITVAKILSLTTTSSTIKKMMMRSVDIWNIIEWQRRPSKLTTKPPVMEKRV